MGQQQQNKAPEQRQQQQQGASIAPPPLVDSDGEEGDGKSAAAHLAELLGKCGNGPARSVWVGRKEGSS